MRAIKDLIDCTLSFDSDLLKDDFKILKVKGDDIIVRNKEGLISSMPVKFVKKVITNGEAKIL